MKNPYESLGVSKSASADEIKSAYRKLAKQYHPDQNPGDKEAEAKFKEISVAYGILSDPAQKSNYDRFGSAEGFGGMGGGGADGFDFGGFDFGNINDIFGSFFGGGGGGFGDIFGGGGGQRQRANRGNNIQVNLNLSFKEACLGVKKVVTFSRFDKCKDCNGTGARNGTAVETCSYCNGRGEVKQTTRLGRFGMMENVVPCSACNATGKMIKEKCGSCSGKGAVKRTINYEVSVPAGIADGQILNISGEGDAAQGVDGISGNLLVGVRVAAHPLLVREDYDLYLELPITFTQAILGDKVRIPAIEGTTDITIPPNTQSGVIIRLKGKGVKRLRSMGSGDLVVRIFVEVPSKLDRSVINEIRKLDNSIPARDYAKQNNFRDKMGKL